jgi:DNA-binding NtrC family response regulator
MTAVNPTVDARARPQELTCKSGVSDAAPAPKFRPGVLIPYGTSMVDAERLILLATLDRCFDNKTRAAEALGISLKTVYNILNRDGDKRGGQKR